MRRGIRMPKSLLPKPAKIAKRELYNAKAMTAAMKRG